MSEGGDIPRRIGSLLRWAVGNLAWILALVAIEQLSEGRYREAAWFGAGAAVDTMVGARLPIFSNRVRRWRIAVGTWLLKGIEIERAEIEEAGSGAPDPIWDALEGDCADEEHGDER